MGLQVHQDGVKPANSLEWHSAVASVRKIGGSLILHSQIVIKTYIEWSYIGDITTQCVSHFQLCYKKKSGIIYHL